MMKRFLILIILISALFTINSQAQIKYGVGLNYSTWLHTPGLNFRLEAGKEDGLVIVPMVDLGVPKFRTSMWINSASLHLHYNIEVLDQLVVYPLAGFTLKSYLDFDNYGSHSIFSQIVVNPTGGAGGKFKLNRTTEVFAEERLEIFGYWQFVTTMGVLVRL